MTHNVIYGSDVQNDANDEKKFYLGVNQTPFKEHFRNPNNKCTNKKCENTTELLKCTWQLMDTNITPLVTWKVVVKVFSETKFNFCILCLTEKVIIINVLHNSQLLN